MDFSRTVANSSQVEELVNLGELPFHIELCDSPHNRTAPDTLPFVAGMRPEIGLVVQVPNKMVERYLEAAYCRGSIVGSPMSEDGIGRRYADDFVRFLSEAMEEDTFAESRLLEIGCGNGYLLWRLKMLGAEVTGIEPGEQGLAASQQYEVNIVRDTFPGPFNESAEKFDVIVHYAVLEHVLEPIQFLEFQRQLLSSAGIVAFAVPDCSEYIKAGDVSMFFHEHWNYFTPWSLKTIVERVGLRPLRIERSKFGGLLYVLAGIEGTSTQASFDRDDIGNLKQQIEEGVRHTYEFFKAAESHGKSTGVFCAARIINLLQIVQPKKLPRFFDDDPRLQGKYYPPHDRRVESRATLKESPVDELIVMSRAFGGKLRSEFVQEEKLKATRITLPDELLGGRKFVL